MGLPELRRIKRSRSDNPWSGERVDGANLELDTFLAARVNRLARLLNKPTYRAYVVDFGISVLEWRVLARLSMMSPCLARDLAVSMGIDKASISRALRRLHKRKLVSIRVCDDDARASILTVLPAGARMYQSILPLARERQATLLNTLDPDERQVLWDAFRKLTSAAEEITQKENQTRGKPKQGPRARAD
jgi:DNA-binding MarR family transcriptional regulator